MKLFLPLGYFLLIKHFTTLDLRKLSSTFNFISIIFYKHILIIIFTLDIDQCLIAVRGCTRMYNGCGIYVF